MTGILKDLLDFVVVLAFVIGATLAIYAVIPAAAL